METSSSIDNDVGGGDIISNSINKLKLRAIQREKALANLKTATSPTTTTSSTSGNGGGGSGNGTIGADFSTMRLKEDHIQRPCWTCPDGTINLEAFHDL